MTGTLDFPEMRRLPQVDTSAVESTPTVAAARRVPDRSLGAGPLV
jgi:hypothetical protein